MTKTPLSNRAPLIVSAAGLVLAACLASTAVLGTRAAAWVAAVGLAIALGTVLTTVKPAPPTIVREPYRRQELPQKLYPRFDAIASKLGSAVRDRRHFDRVLAPLLRDIAADLTRSSAAGSSGAQLRSTLGETLWPLLDPDRPPATGVPADPPAPNIEELAALTDRLEHLEQPWT